MRKLVILISGAGSNMEALALAARRENWAGRFDATIAAVISNRPDAAGLVRAQALGLPTEVLDHRAFASRAAFDVALMERIDFQAPTLVLLAGFMRILTPDFVHHYAGRLLNIHPSLLPAFPGLHTHRRAIDAGCQVAGATVHWVRPTVDGIEDGSIVDQAVVPVLPGDDEAALAARVLSQEHRLYPQAVRGILARLTGEHPPVVQGAERTAGLARPTRDQPLLEGAR